VILELECSMGEVGRRNVTLEDPVLARPWVRLNASLHQCQQYLTA